MTPSRLTWVDPNDGWQYGFPKLYDPDKDWEVVYLAANQDAFSIGTQMGIAGNMTKGFVANTVGTQSAYTATSLAVSNYRGATTNGS